MKVKQTLQFKKTIKKLPKQTILLIEKEIKKLVIDPMLGEPKKGDLSFLRVHKFKVLTQQYLLGYSYEADTLVLTLLKLGSHENFYRDIKK